MGQNFRRRTRIPHILRACGLLLAFFAFVATIVIVPSLNTGAKKVFAETHQMVKKTSTPSPTPTFTATTAPSPTPTLTHTPAPSPTPIAPTRTATATPLPTPTLTATATPATPSPILTTNTPTHTAQTPGASLTKTAGTTMIASPTPALTRTAATGVKASGNQHPPTPGTANGSLFLDAGVVLAALALLLYLFSRNQSSIGERVLALLLPAALLRRIRSK